MDSNEINENIALEQNAALEELFKVLASSSDSKFISDFFGCLFTPSELSDFATRWLLVKEIDKGTTQREIAQKYHISLCKITRGSKELKKSESAFRRMLDFASTISTSGNIDKK